MKIQKVETELYHVPLARPMVDAIHGMQKEFSLIVVKITTDDGATGMGYTYSVGQVGGSSIATLIRDNLTPILVGEDPRRIEQLWNKMWWALHYVGRSGIAVFGMSAVDTALWDLKARLAGEPLWRFLGGHDNKVEAYGGGIDFDLSYRPTARTDTRLPRCRSPRDQDQDRSRFDRRGVRADRGDA